MGIDAHNNIYGYYFFAHTNWSIGNLRAQLYSTVMMHTEQMLANGTALVFVQNGLDVATSHYGHQLIEERDTEVVRSSCLVYIHCICEI